MVRNKSNKARQFIWRTSSLASMFRSKKLPGISGSLQHLIPAVENCKHTATLLWCQPRKPQPCQTVGTATGQYIRGKCDAPGKVRVATAGPVLPSAFPWHCGSQACPYYSLVSTTSLLPLPGAWETRTSSQSLRLTRRLKEEDNRMSRTGVPRWKQTVSTYFNNC